MINPHEIDLNREPNQPSVELEALSDLTHRIR
jgi:hypothetical protein